MVSVYYKALIYFAPFAYFIFSSCLLHLLHLFIQILCFSSLFCCFDVFFLIFYNFVTLTALLLVFFLEVKASKLVEMKLIT